jgi:hypothetical protein
MYSEDCTISPAIVDGKFFGYCLEDTVRPQGVKVKGKTAIPAGRYEVVVTVSNRFKRLMPLLLDVEGFDGIRIHGGNTSEDTDGCLLIAQNVVGDNKVFGTLEARVTAMILSDEKAGKKSYVHIFACRA